MLPASNPVFSTVLLSLTEVPHWSLQGLGKSNGGQLQCFDEPSSASRGGRSALIARTQNARAYLVFTHTVVLWGRCVHNFVQLTNLKNKILDVYGVIPIKFHTVF